MSLTARLDALLVRREPARYAAFARILVGVAALFKVAYLLRVATEILAPTSLRVPWGQGWPLPSLGVVQVVLAVWVGAAVLFVAGWHHRVAAVVLAMCIGFMLLADRHFYQNHLYLLLLLVVLLGLARSADTLALGAGSSASDGLIPAWPLELVRVQVTIVYVFGALTKLNADYLSGATVAGAWMGTAQGTWLVELLGRPGMVVVSVLTVGLELWLAFALWTVTRRRAAIAVGLVLHLAILVVIPLPVDLTVFALLMMSGYLAFLSCDGDTAHFPGSRRSDPIQHA